MGMYSYVDWSEIEFRGRTSQANFEDWLGDLKCPKYVPDLDKYGQGELPEQYVKEKERVKEAWEKSENNPEKFIEEWLEDTKVISYWYDGFCYILRDIAMFFEGEIHLNFEQKDEAWNIHFEDGQCLVERGLMKWDKKETLEQNGFVEQLPSKEKLFRAI